MNKTHLKFCLTIAFLISMFPLSNIFAGNIIIHTIESQYQNGKQEIHVLLPDNYREDKLYRVLYVLPVEKEFDQRYGYGLGELKRMDAHNKYDLIIVQMGFEKEPWYGDHSTDPKARQASYLKEFVVPYIENYYSTMPTSKGRLLFGFSKSGWGAFSLIMTYPEFFGYAASWDAPMFLDKFYLKMEAVYGTTDQLNIYRPDLLASKQKKYFQNKPRLVLSGEQGWGKSIPTPTGSSHTVQMHKLLVEEGIKHVYDNSINVPHTWNEQWMSPALKALILLTEDAMASYKHAVKIAEELKAQIEPDKNPLPKFRCLTYGVIDLTGEEQKSLFKAYAGGNGFWSERILTVNTPGKPDEVKLYIYWDGTDMYDPANLEWSKNAGTAAYAIEREFRDKIKYAYDYMPEGVILAQPDNPKYAPHFWGKENGDIFEGPLNIRRYKGKPVFGVVKEKIYFEEGSFVYVRSGRGSLYAYDKQVDEHFLLYHCDNRYSGPSVIAKVDSWLLIGLWTEGLVAVDLEDYYLKRFDSFRETVGKIEVTDSEIIIDDGRHKIPLPIKRNGPKSRTFYFGPRGAK